MRRPVYTQTAQAAPTNGDGTQADGDGLTSGTLSPSFQWSCYNPITPQEQGMVKNGDPVADIALGTLGKANFNYDNGQAANLDEFHQGLAQAHIDATMANGNGNTPLSRVNLHDRADKGRQI